MYEKIDHIGIAVKDLKHSMDMYRTLGFEIVCTERVETQKVNLALIRIGESMLELLEPMDEASPLAKSIERRGEGVHHIAFAVTDIVDALRRLKNAGVRLIDEMPRTGAGGAKIAFIHPKSTCSVLLELVEHG